MAGSLAISLVFGSLLAAAKLGKNKPLKIFASGYTAVMRSIPPIVLIFLIYHGVPLLWLKLFGINISRIVDTVYFVILALGLMGIAQLSEIIKSAYRSVREGQYEAAVCSGLSPVQAIRRIMLPQALRISIPNLGNFMITLLKEGSLGYTIGLIDIMGRANILNSITYGNNLYEIFFTLAVIYWILSIIIERGFLFMDDRLSIDRKIRLAALAAESGVRHGT
jgi:L-cystine transport system permease protein